MGWLAKRMAMMIVDVHEGLSWLMSKQVMRNTRTRGHRYCIAASYENISLKLMVNQLCMGIPQGSNPTHPYQHNTLTLT